jgi:hypothetical protein
MMFKKILLIASLALPTITFAESIQIDSPTLQSLPSQELGQVVLKFMPSTSDTVSWYTNANDTTFRWIDRKYTEITLDDGTVISSRRAVYRGKVNGVKSTYLDDRVYEMPWLLTLQGDSLGKFGVNSVSFEPYIIGIDSQDETTCFGSTHENCDFSPFNSLKKAGISYKKICENQMGYGNFDIVYLLSKQGKKNTYGIWSQSSGSGGSSNSFALDYSTSNAAVCKKVKS